MKIAIIPRASTITPKSHGYTKRLYHLCEGLVRLGHTVKISGSMDSKLPKGAKLIKWNKPRKMDYPSQLEYISDAIKKSQDCDIINCQCDHLSLTFDKWSKVPVLHTVIYGRLYDDVIDYMKEFPKSLFMATSNFLKKRYGFLKFKGIVYNGLNIKEFPLSIKKRKDYFLYLARISQDKQTHLAVKWAKKHKFKLIIAGNINDQSYFDKKIKPFLSKNIKYVGKIGFSKKIKYLQQAKATFSLDDYEAFGNSIIESLACGTPIIGFNNGSFPEIITHKKDGYVLRSLKDIKNAIKFVENIKHEDCRKKAEKFNVQKMVENYEKLYLKIIKQNESRNR
ncbi:glycosyltransferase [Patescibacteria group bacterium]